VTFRGRLFEDYGPLKPEDELLPSDHEPISSGGDRPGELLDNGPAHGWLAQVDPNTTSGGGLTVFAICAS
jgi:hypothetical protein